MYSESDLEAAVAAGALKEADVAKFRRFMAADRSTALVDEEHFRLVSGFNDIFVAIASVLLLVAIAWLGSEIQPWLGALGVAVAAWGLAEYFTKVRRMAFPSILLLLAFVGGLFGAVGMGLIGDESQYGPGDEAIVSAYISIAGAVAAAGAFFHWRRFRVPITIAAGAGAVVATIIGILAVATDGNVEPFLHPLLFVSGLGVFALAMRWDISDPVRETRRSDVAFWLHLLAAPLIVHPIFAEIGVLEGALTVGGAVLVIGLYIAMGGIALAIDRRALMVSSLVYVLWALNGLFERFGAVETNVALAALVIGSALLLLSAFWHNARGLVVRPLPEAITNRLPVIGKETAVV
ncbi:hypothetical protein HFP57_06140 [Parasphingopyxis algicola]|uniref:hypothetical protein n=1 Tax=Parasphingopyxis algicola TaxID=2026624 RepID=UPI0015A45549|nr:hypothetical protein [Parasphingopyxis algicola]QLC24651.1 hypothetical protein HFP57_06140 [Parasphingopyxis algicola]